MRWLISLFLHLASLLTFFACISVYLLLIIFLSPYKIQMITHLLCRLILLSSGQWLVIEGELLPAGRSYLYLSNHESILDAFIFGAALSGRVTAVAAEDYFSIPIWGAIMRRYGVIPIQRKIHEKAMDSMGFAEQSLCSGTSIIICPEGTRTKTGRVEKFKSGAFHLAHNAQPVIVPLAIVGSFEARNRNSWLIRPGLLRLRFGRPILPEQYEGLSPAEISDLVRQEIIFIS